MYKIAKAESLLSEYGNCCTAVLASFCEDFGMETNLAVRATQAMPGVGLTGHVCGAVSGAALVIGLSATKENEIVDHKQRNRACEIVREFTAEFEKRNGSIVCRDLLGRDISTPEKFSSAQEDNAFVHCPGFVRSAVEILNDMDFS